MFSLARAARSSWLRGVLVAFAVASTALLVAFAVASIADAAVSETTGITCYQGVIKGSSRGYKRLIEGSSASHPRVVQEVGKGGGRDGSLELTGDRMKRQAPVIKESSAGHQGDGVTGLS